MMESIRMYALLYYYKSFPLRCKWIPGVLAGRNCSYLKKTSPHACWSGDMVKEIISACDSSLIISALLRLWADTHCSVVLHCRSLVATNGTTHFHDIHDTSIAYRRSLLKKMRFQKDSFNVQNMLLKDVIEVCCSL